MMLFSCQKESKHLEFVDENEALVEDLSEVEGNARTFNSDFKILNGPQRTFYYAPVDIPKALNSIPEEMKDVIHLPDVGELPFTPGTSEANIVTFWNTENTLMFQIQISYFENAAEYHADNQDFFIISAASLADNPFIDNPESTKDSIDNWRIKFNVDGADSPSEIVIYRELDLIDDLPLFFKNLFPHWSTMYAYYSYDGTKIIHRSAGAKIYYAWYDGVLFQIGYKYFNDPTIDMETVVRQIILGS
jgi:hypothetical protein